MRLRVLYRSKSKIFIIGRNKTGTTSMKLALKELGFIVGDQYSAEYQLQKAYLNRDNKKIIKFCQSAEAFQDFPFSYPETFKYMDNAFPESKFILTLRNSPEDWYESQVRYHSKHFGKNGRIPTKDDLFNANYVRKGWVYNNFKNIYKTDDSDLYNKEKLIKSYEIYNLQVKNYFKDRQRKLLVLNLAEKGAYKKFLSFLEIESSDEFFPWENRTK